MAYDNAQATAEEAMNQASNTEQPEWPDPITIEAPLPPVKPFTPDTLLPDVLRPWVMDAAEAMPASPDFVAVTAITALGSVIGARCSVKPKQYDNWTVVPNLWGGIVGIPAAKKSPAMGAALKPLENLGFKARETYKEELAKYGKEELLWSARKKALEDELKQAAKRETKNQTGEDSNGND